MFKGEIKKRLQNGQNLALTKGKGRNGIEKTRLGKGFFQHRLKID
jgi:hypothetical protein